LLPAAFLFATLFHSSYSSIPFIVFFQILWFYKLHEKKKRLPLSSFLIFNGLLFLFCLPWLLFLSLNYKRGALALMDPFQEKVTLSFWSVLYGILHDWVPHPPLLIASIILLILFVFFTKIRTNALTLLSVFFFPIAALYLFCKWFDIYHFITSRYFINFLPPFFISLYLSLDAIKTKFEKLKRLMRLDLLFLFLFIASNLMILPLYYRAEKEDFRGLVNYLKANLREGDKLFDAPMAYIPGILFYFGTIRDGRHYTIPFWKTSTGEVQYGKSFVYQNRTFTIYHSNTCCNQYLADGGRLWLIGGSRTANKLRGQSLFVLKGYFDGSFLNFNRFPTDASMYLFLWDPKSPNEKGIDMPIE
jgi:hypothetical protein